MSFLVVAVILDRSVDALRESLQLAHRRGEELARLHAALQAETLEKQRSQDQLIQAQKVEAVGRVSSGIAHDFNNILGVIMGYASRPEAISSHAAAVDSLDGIRFAAQRGGMAIRRILNLGRSENAVRAVIDVRTAIRGVLPLMEQIFGDRVILRADLAREVLPVLVYLSELELVLLNIATNARDAMPDGGRFAISTALDGDDAVLTLTDNGRGMDGEAQRRLFELFYTTKPLGRGTGIGLAAVKRFVEDMHGRIDVRSEPDRGTTVTMRLPLAAAGVGHAAGGRSIAGLRVLLIEDDEVLRVLLADALVLAGAAVFIASSGKEALRLAQARALDVLISDYHLPDMTAGDVLADMRQLYPSLCCLIISADERAAATLPSPDRTTQFLAKPFVPARLVAAVATFDRGRTGVADARTV